MRHGHDHPDQPVAKRRSATRQCVRGASSKTAACKLASFRTGKYRPLLCPLDRDTPHEADAE
jgi:hypothetical protein